MLYPLLTIGVLQGWLHRLYLTLFHLGGFGLLIFGFLDSSPLVFPFGNDLLMIAMTAIRHSHLIYYVLMATVGSLLGCLVVDTLSRKSGEKTLEKKLPRRRFDYIKRRIRRNAALTLAVAALMPPPFPFTAFVAGAAAFQYPRRRVLVILFLSRFIRFLVEGVLAILLGDKLLRVARSPILGYLITTLIVFSIAGSALAIGGWTKDSKGASAGKQ